MQLDELPSEVRYLTRLMDLNNYIQLYLHLTKSPAVYKLFESFINVFNLRLLLMCQRHVTTQSKLDSQFHWFSERRCYENSLPISDDIWTFEKIMQALPSSGGGAGLGDLGPSPRTWGPAWGLSPGTWGPSPDTWRRGTEPRHLHSIF